MTTEKTLDQMMELLPFITPILEDESVKSLRDILRPKEGTERAEFSAGELFARLFPVMIGNHRAELYGILSVLTGENTEAVKKKPYSEIKKVLQSDSVLKDFFDFFPFLLQMALRA